MERVKGVNRFTSTSPLSYPSTIGFFLLSILVGILSVFLGETWDLASYLVLLIFVAVGVLLSIMRWPQLGVYWSMVAAPIEVGLIQIAGYGMYVFQPVTVAACGALLVHSILKNGKVFMPRKIWPIIGLWLAFILSVGSAIDLETSLGGVVYFIPIIALCWVMAYEGRQIRAYLKLQQAVIWSGLFFALVGLVQLGLYHMGILLTFGPRHTNFLQLYSRPSGLQAEPVWFGIYTATILGMSIPLWVRSEGIFQHQSVGALALLVLGLAVLVSGTRSAWVGLLVAFFVYLLMVWKLLLRIAGKVLVLGLFLIGVLLLVTEIWPRFLEPLTRLQFLLDPSEQNSVVRLNTWLFAWEYIRLRPIGGYGLSAWEVIAPQVMEYTSLTIIGGKSVPNFFLENWLSAGLPGLVLAIVFYAYYAFQLWYVLRRSTNRYARASLESIFLGFVVVLTASFFTNAFKHNWFWIVIGLCIAAIYAFGESGHSHPRDGRIENPTI